MKKLNYIDLFSGCGGLTEGFEKSGFYNPLAFVDWDYYACKTLINRLEKKWNIKNSNQIVIHDDIRNFQRILNGFEGNNNFSKHIGLRKLVGRKKVDIIIGGPPCQAYSVAGRVQDPNGMNYDYRNYLFEKYLAAVKEFRPKFFLFENVPGILSAKPGGISIISRISESFKEIGYSISADMKKFGLINSAEFGIPQIRRRVFILGINNDENKKSKNIFSLFFSNLLEKEKSKRVFNVRDAIGDLPKFFPSNKKGNNELGYTSHNNDFLNHIPRSHSERDKKIFKLLSKDILLGENKFKSIEARKRIYKEVTGKDSNFHKYNVLDFEKPSNTIPAHLYKDGLRHIHPDPDQERTITPREAARLQSFDDDFEFIGPKTQQYKMIGNSVPPELSYKIAKKIVELY